MATTATGRRFHTNSTTAPPRTRKVMALSAMAITAGSPVGSCVMARAWPGSPGRRDADQVPGHEERAT